MVGGPAGTVDEVVEEPIAMALVDVAPGASPRGQTSQIPITSPITMRPAINLLSIASTNLRDWALLVKPVLERRENQFSEMKVESEKTEVLWTNK